MKRSVGGFAPPLTLPLPAQFHIAEEIGCEHREAQCPLSLAAPRPDWVAFTAREEKAIGLPQPC